VLDQYLTWVVQTAITAPDTPHIVFEWVKVAASIAIIFTAVGGFFTWLFRRLFAVLNLKVDTVQINQEANAIATLGAIQRLESIETTVNNGLSERTQRTQEDLDVVKGDLVVVREQVAEMHGWMQAQE